MNGGGGRKKIRMQMQRSIQPQSTRSSNQRYREEVEVVEECMKSWW